MQLPEMASLEGGPTNDSGSVLLTELAVGAVARFESTDEGVDHSTTERSYLEALGLYRGNELRVCKIGEPWIVEVDHTRVALTTPLARRVRVKR